MKHKMIQTSVLACLISMASVGFAQVAPIDFETEGNGADWTWTPFENDSNPPVGVVANPDQTGINTSATAASFTALTTGQPWAGCESQHGADIGTYSINVSNSTIKIMVYKPVLSDVGIKLVKPDGWSMGEIKVANTVINEWEELTFDFSSQMQDGYDQIVIFPDFDLAGRATDNTCYFDNITFSGHELPPGPAAHAPVPTEPADDVISVFSDSYENIAGTNFYPGWGQATVVTEVAIEGNNTLLYSGLNYQGIELGSTQDLTGMENLHVDFWSANSNALQVFLISVASGEQAYTFTVSNDAWVSVDIPLTTFSDLGLALNDIFQLKFVGDGDVYLDNLYFLGEVIVVEEGPNAPIDFEVDGYGADWTWTVFENDSNPALEIIANPFSSGINTSATVAKFTALQAGAPWAGVESLHGGGDIGTFSFSTTNSTVKMMVYKSVISDVGIKFAESNGEAQPEVKVANTVINEWEELTFDLSGSIGMGITGIIDQIIVFPDFQTRTSENICYFDNITFSEGGGGGGPGGAPEVAAPVPNDNASGVISIFSDTYTNIDGVNLNPGWGQATVVSEVAIAGNNTLKYAGLNYQGTEFTAKDVSGMNYIHVDYWTDNSTALNFFVISQTPTVDSDYHTFALVSEQWVSVDIPLTTYPNVDLADVFQFKVEGNGTIYWDNLYFHSNPVSVDDGAELLPQEFALEQNFPNPFNPSTTIRYSLVESGHVVLKLFNINGQEVTTLVDEMAGSGEYIYNLNAGNLAAGTYLYSLTVGQQSSVKKMVLIK